MKKIVVLGAGISGLAFSWFLKQRWKSRVDVTILEKSERAGGWIRTLQEDEFQFEAGPRGFCPRGKGEATLELVQTLNLSDQLLASTKDSKKRYIYLNGRLNPFGLSFLFKQRVITAALRDLFTCKTVQEDESIACFVNRRLNSHLAEKVMDPLTKGIFGGNIQELSMRSCFPTLWQWEQKYGSIIRGILAKRKKKTGVSPFSYTFRDGMETLTRALSHQLQDSLKFGQTILSLDAIEADWIISTLPMHALAPLLGCTDCFTYVTLTLIHLGWHKRVLPQTGYGFLVPSIEKGEILGMTWDSEVFPKNLQTRLCIMMSGKRSEQDLNMQTQAILQKYVGVDTPPDVLRVTIAERAIPQYTLGHHQRIEAIKKTLPKHVSVIGTCFTGPGVNDSIFAARHLAQGVLF